MHIQQVSPREALATAIGAALNAGASGESLAQLVIESGWHSRPTQEPDREYLEGLLDSGQHIPIEIRHARTGRVLHA